MARKRRAVISVATGQYFSLEPSDVILEINNQRVGTEEQFARALKISPRRMVLLVRDCRSGRVDTQVTILFWP
ncbi:MAG: hypothetical protein FJ276_27730 [Planctomycetes bacterium]|nr:hypothetical protein [Planctomycetota bacterium]